MFRRESNRQSKAQGVKQARPKAIGFLSKSEGAEHADPSMARPQKAHDSNDESQSDAASVGSNGEEDDLDAPRVAQWIDDEDFELQAHTGDTSESESDSEEPADDDDSASATPSRELRSLEHDLSTLPLGTLRSAQRSLTRAHALSDTESDSDAHSGFITVEGDHSSHPHLVKVKREKLPDQTSRPPIKRSNKHAPVEMTSKRPVSRRRVVIDDNLLKPRDPRFMHSVGHYDSTKFKQQYEFLSGLRRDELTTLRGHLKRARKLLANSPVHLRADREEEVKRLERAMKTSESAVNLDNREQVELKALQSAKQAEKEKRKQGKAGWWMKRSEKKELLTKARIDAIASVGGRQAVKKALEKRRRKSSQKEKKMRPFPQSRGIEGPDGKKRRPVGSVDSDRRVKRRKI